MEMASDLGTGTPSILDSELDELDVLVPADPE